MALILAALAVSCGPRDSKVLRVGVDNAPPFHIVRANGSVEGMAIDVFTEAARRRHIRVIWVPWHGQVEDALSSGAVDAWPEMSRTPARDRLFHFTEAWIQSEYYLVTRSGSGISRENIAGKKLSLAGFGRLKIVASRFLPKAFPVFAPNHARALSAFCRGEAEAALVDARSLDHILLARPESCGQVALHLELLPDAGNPVSIASTLAAAATADSLRKGIIEMARDGVMWGPVDKWSGFTAGQTRAFFALREAESRRDQYLLGLAAVTLSLVGFAWAIARMRSAQKRTKVAQLAAAESEARFAAFMDNSPLIGFIKDEQGRMIYLNKRYVEVFGIEPGQCLGKNDHELWPPEIAAELRRNDLKIIASGESVEFVETTPVKGDYVTWLSLKFPFRQGSQTWLGGMCIDISERERAREALRISEERFRSLFSHATVGIAIADRSGALVRVNAAFCRILGLHERECLERNVQQLLDDGTRMSAELLHERAAAGETFETRLRRNAITLWTENCLFEVRDAAGRTANIVVIVEDVTQRKTAEAQLDYQARHDVLTGLTNRRVHESYLEAQLEKAASAGDKVCLLYVDLDDFKMVNDSMGHDAGDLLLQEAAARLSSLVRDKHCLSRIGGDEFVLVENVRDSEEADALASRLRLAMERPFQINGTYVELRASAGFSIFPDDGLDARTLRKKADDAMYAAKRSGKSVRYSRAQAQPEDALSALSALQ